jgi:hypothetical protein
MKHDPIVEEVRQVRKQIEAECGRDPKAYARHLRRVQESLGRKLVRRQPQRALEPAASAA